MGVVRVEGVLLDAQLQKAARDEDRARHVALLELIPLADVDHQRRWPFSIARIQRLGRGTSVIWLFARGNQLVAVDSCHGWCVSKLSA